MKGLLALVAVACFANGALATCLPKQKVCGNECPGGYGRWNNMCYKYFPRELKFSDALEYCKRQRGICRNGDGHLLPTISEAENNAGLQSYRAACIKSPKDTFWVGYTRKSGKWAPVASVARSYKYYPWADKSKAEDRSSKLNCAAMNTDGKWITDDCDAVKPFICRIIQRNH